MSIREGETLGERTNSIRWLQRAAQRQAAQLPRVFQSLEEWEAYKRYIRDRLPEQIGLPEFPPLGESLTRGRFGVGDDVICERVDVAVDDDYAIPTLVFGPRAAQGPRPALVWNPGWLHSKFIAPYQHFAARMARQGFVVAVLDHAPFGETSAYQMDDKGSFGMTAIMSLGDMLGISQLALRAAETRRVGEYLRARADVDETRVAVAGLCQGGMDTWMSAALDDGFAAAACFCSASTFAVNATELTSHHVLSDPSPYPFGVLKVCDVEHLHAAIAPRPLLVRANLPDHWWPVSGLARIEALAGQVYELYGAREHFDIRAEVHEHDLTGVFADQLEAFLLRYLGDGRSQ